MRYPVGRKAETRARIVEAAGKVFRRRGYQASGVDQVMEQAGLTSGGFYAHFESKEALLAEVIVAAGLDAGARHESALKDREGSDWLDGFLDRYLSLRHRDDPEVGCPLPALVSEASRAGEPARRGFESVVTGLADLLARHAGEAKPTDDRLLAVVALCVGGIGLARSVQDEAMADRLLGACRDAARKILEGP